MGTGEKIKRLLSSIKAERRKKMVVANKTTLVLLGEEIMIETMDDNTGEENTEKKSIYK